MFRSPGRTDHLLHMVISVKTLTLVLPLCSLISLMKKFKVAPQDVVDNEILILFMKLFMILTGEEQAF